MFTPTCKVTCPCRLTAARLTPACSTMMQQSCGRSRRVSLSVHVSASQVLPARVGIRDGPRLICIWHEQTCGLFSLLPELRSAGCRFMRFKAESSYLGQIYGLFFKDMSVLQTKRARIHSCNLEGLKKIEKKHPQRSSSNMLGELVRITRLHFYLSRNSKSLRKWQVMGILEEPAETMCNERSLKLSSFHSSSLSLHPLLFCLISPLVFQVEMQYRGKKA